jgi:hypothetical protein
MKFKNYGLTFILIISLLSCSTEQSDSSSYEKLSQGRYGGSHDEEFSSSTSTSDGGQIILTKTFSNDGDVIGNLPTSMSNVAIWVIKLNSKCEIEWKKTYGGSNTELGDKIIQTKDGGYLFSALITSTDGNMLPVDSSVPPGYSGSNSLLVKIDALGSIQWQKVTSYNNNTALDIIQTVDGGYLYNSYFSLNKLDANANLMWTKSLDFYCYNIYQLADSNIILSGCVNSNEYFNTTGIIAKTDSRGNILWKNTYEKTLPSKVIESIDGGLLAVGRSNNKNVPVYFNNNYINNIIETAAYPWVSKLNLSGGLEWEKAFGIKSGPTEIVTDIVSIKNGYMVGGYSGDFWILNIDKLGNFINQKTFGGSDNDILNRIDIGQNGTLFLSGTTQSKDGDLKNTNSHGDFNTDIWTLNVRIN